MSIDSMSTTSDKKGSLLSETPVETGAFRDRSIVILAVLLVASLIINLAAIISRKTVLEGSAVISDGQPYESQPFETTRSTLLPGYRIKVDASTLPMNHELTYEVTLLEENRTELFEYEQNVWRESGRWQEGFESGTWYEADVEKEFTFVPHKSGKYRLMFAVGEALRQGGGPRASSFTIPFTVVKNVASGGLLWASFFSLLVGLIAVMLMTASSVQTIGEPFFGRRNLRKRATEPFKVDDPANMHAAVLLLDFSPRYDPMTGDGVSFELMVTGPDGRGVRIEDTVDAISHKTDEDGDIIRVYTKKTYYFVPAEQGKHVLGFRVISNVPVVESANFRIQAGVKSISKVNVYFIGKNSEAKT
ncbi:MAG: hypothetical protein GY847_10905 [Proteobacteria bacterium]|nr:hypothetical protein [Pseudomonadota bacterium]